MDISGVIRRPGGEDGYVTFDQLNELIPSAKAEPEDIEAILTASSERHLDCRGMGRRSCGIRL